MAAPRQPPRVFTVPPGVPFLPTLADALLSGGLVPIDRPDPLGLAGVTVLLPTRRAVRAFSDALAARLGKASEGAAILPSIRTIGDIDEEEQLLDPLFGEGADALALPQPIAPLTRRLALTRLTLAWAKTIRRHPLAGGSDDALRIPASVADATRLAGDLARLLDDVNIAGVPWSKLANLVPDDHAEYFQLTLEFLKIVSEQWPLYLREQGRADPSERRNELIRAAAERLRNHGSPGPIIAAGSTGSVPATADLLEAIATQPNGAVVLPGLDQTLDPVGWRAIGEAESPAAAFGHPQFFLKQLIATLGVARDEVKPLAAPSHSVAARAALLAEALRPADTLDAWAGVRPAAGALEAVDLIVARNEQEEATAIALVLRETVETSGRTAALVTPDRALARRVAVELGRWGLAVDDSAGVPLGHEPHGVFVRLLAEAAVSDADPVKLVSLLKHRFAAFGMTHAACGQAARTLEVALFRGRRTAGGVARLGEVLAHVRAETRTARHVPSARRRLSDKQWDLAADLAARLAECLGPIAAAVESGAPITASESARLMLTALANAAADETRNDAAFWQEPGGVGLAALLDGLIEEPEAGELKLDVAELPFVLAALFADATVSRRPGDDTRIHIWGALEARLQSVDCLVLGGLDEGVWPAGGRTDPWLSRSMRGEIGLPPPERRLGLSAHDFFQGMASPRVVVTRAEKRGGAPTVESRWLQRLAALIGKEAEAELRSRGNVWVEYARRLDEAPDKPSPTRRPAPKPPVAVRPTHLSITEIETLIRDPYATYARRILKLDPLEPLGRAPDGSLRGSIIHDALGRFTQEWPARHDAAALDRLLALGRESLREVADFPDVYAVWALRFTAIANWFTAWEGDRDAAVAARHAEIDGALAVPVPGGVFTLRGRADRIDLMRDGSLAIYDFKTGTPQTERTVFAGLTPQMTLEAAMARAGGFDEVLAKLGAEPLAGRSVADLAWLAVGKAGRQDPYVSAVKDRQNPDDLADSAHGLLKELIVAFADESRPYLSRARPMMERSRYLGDYDHLARVREWALLESEEDVMGGGA